MSFTCSGCDSHWTGQSRAHCSGCHHTFSTVGNFDSHRKGSTCNSPESVGLVMGPTGVFHAPGTDRWSSNEKENV